MFITKQITMRVTFVHVQNNHALEYAESDGKLKGRGLENIAALCSENFSLTVFPQDKNCSLTSPSGTLCVCVERICSCNMVENMLRSKTITVSKLVVILKNKCSFLP